MSLHDTRIRLHHMLDYAREAVSLVAGKSKDDLPDDRLLDLSLLHLITMIGEVKRRIVFPKIFKPNMPKCRGR